jgi:hypothetical protein
MIQAETVYRIACDQCSRSLADTDERWLQRDEVSRLARETDWDIPYGGPHLCGACKDGAR